VPVRGATLRQVAILSVGTGVSQAISLAVTPIVSRAFGPQALGELNILTSLLSVLAAVATLSLPLAIVAHKEDQHARTIAHLASWTTCTVSLLSLIVVTVAQFSGSERIFGVPLTYLWLVPPLLMLMGIAQVGEQWLIRSQAYAALAGAQVGNAVVQAGAKIAGAIFAPVAFTLLAIHALGLSLSAAVLHAIARRHTLGDGRRVPLQACLRLRELECDSFVLYRTPQALLNTVSFGAPAIMLGSLMGPTVATPWPQLPRNRWRPTSTSSSTAAAATAPRTSCRPGVATPCAGRAPPIAASTTP